MIGPLQIVLLSIVAAFTVVCGQNWFQTANQPVFTGMMAGIIMGDPVTGLFIGGSMQLTVLGIGTFGGSSHIDANSGAILATAFSVALGMDPSQALAAIAVPVAAILTTADVLGRFCNAFFQQRIDSLIEKDDYAGILGVFMIGSLIASNLNVAFTVNPSVAGATINLQNTLNTVLPGLLPAGIVAVIYWMLGRKGMTSTKAIFIVLVAAVALSALGIIAKG